MIHVECNYHYFCTHFVFFCSSGLTCLSLRLKVATNLDWLSSSNSKIRKEEHPYFSWTSIAKSKESKETSRSVCRFVPHAPFEPPESELLWAHSYGRSCPTVGRLVGKSRRSVIHSFIHSFLSSFIKSFIYLIILLSFFKCVLSLL